MGIQSSLFSGVSGLNANGNAMTVVGNNIANSNTIGFKASRTIFSDMLSTSIAGSGGSSQIGRGVGLSSIDNMFSQGTFENTESNTDLAIEGPGFFMVSNPDTGTINYTRAGAFSFDDNGMLINPEGYAVQGYYLDVTTGDPVGDVTDLQIETKAFAPAEQTTSIDLATNLNANSAYMGVEGDGISPFDINDPARTSNYASSVRIFDSLGKEHMVTTYFNKLDPADNPEGYMQWEAHVVVAGEDVQAAAIDDWVEVGRSVLTFDTGGRLVNSKNVGDYIGGTIDSNYRAYDPDGDMYETTNVLTGAGVDTPTYTYAGIQGDITQNDTFEFTYNETSLTATIGATGGATATASEVQDAIDAALTASVFDAGDVVVSYSGTGDVVLTVADTGDTLVANDFTDDPLGTPVATAASATPTYTYADIQPNMTTGDTIEFTYDGTAYVATLTDGTTNLQSDIEAAVDSSGTALGAGNVTASIDGTDLVLTSSGGATLVGGTFTGTDDFSYPLTTDIEPEEPFPTIKTVDGALSWINESAQDQVIAFAFDATQYTSESDVISQSQDGFATGTLVSLSIDSDGNILGNYSNGEPRQLARIALAKFSNPLGLNKAGNNLYEATNESGTPVIGTVGSGVGNIFINSLEMSNVDLAQEFVKMITTQRGFQANSKVITTTDELLGELINLKR